MKTNLFYTITKRSYYDFVRQSIPMPPLERIQFTHFNIQQSYTLSWYNTHKQLCTCNLRGDDGYATLTLKTGDHISTFRLTESPPAFKNFAPRLMTDYKARNWLMTTGILSISPHSQPPKYRYMVSAMCPM